MSTSEASGEPRPRAPDIGILERAASALQQREGRHEPVLWRVRTRMERPKSTVFVMDADQQGRPSVWFYKHDLATRDGVASHGLAMRRRRSLEVEAQLGDRLTASAAGRFAVDDALVVDPERLVGVRTQVTGRELGKALRWARPDRRGMACDAYRRVGEALRTVEEIGRHIDAPTAPEQLERQLHGALERSRTMLSDRAGDWARSAIARLVPIVADDGLVWSHGDVSPTNVLVEAGRIGLIDFSWAPQLPGWDLVRFVARLECESPRLKSWTATLVREVHHGYGLDIDDPPLSWQLAQLHRCLLAVSDRHPIVRRWGVDRLVAEANR